ncbi:MAG: DnaB-like helicase N-terminal domain-containing protein, partial [Verrucomicrobiota bacterium]
MSSDVRRMIDSVSESAGAAPDFKKARRRKAASSEVHRADRLPPHSAEAEQGVLGCVLLSPNECLGQCIEKFKPGPEVFYDLRHQTIYEAVIAMYDKRDPIDIIMLQQRLKDRGLLDQIGGIAYLNALQDAVPSAANLTYYLDI